MLIRNVWPETFWPKHFGQKHVNYKRFRKTVWAKTFWTKRFDPKRFGQTHFGHEINVQGNLSETKTFDQNLLVKTVLVKTLLVKTFDQKRLGQNVLDETFWPKCFGQTFRPKRLAGNGRNPKWDKGFWPKPFFAENVSAQKVLVKTLGRNV